MSEAIFIPRNITERSWVNNPATFYLFLKLVLKANQQGEIITSVASLARGLHLKDNQVKYGLACLRNDKRITYQGTNRYTKITICDYESYLCPFNGTEEQASCKQICEQETNKKNAPLLPPDGSSPCTPSSLTPYIPQEKKKTAVADKESAKRFVKPSVEEIRAYCRERHNTIDAEKFFYHYEANGWMVGPKKPMKNWKAAVITWEKNQKEMSPQPTTKPEKILTWKDIEK